MSVPRPAMFVETVTLPGSPARATMSASAAMWLALRTWCSMPALVQQLGEMFRLVDRAGADQQRPAGGVQLADFLDDGRPLGVGRAEDAVGQPLADGRPVGGNRQHVAAIDSPQLAGRAHRRAGHARQVLVAEEEVLHGDPRRLAGGHGDLDALLGLDGLVDAVAPLAAFGQAGR